MQNNRLVLLRYLRMSEQFLHSIRDVDDLARTARDDKQKGVQFLSRFQTHKIKSQTIK